MNTNGYLTFRGQNHVRIVKGGIGIRREKNEKRNNDLDEYLPKAIFILKDLVERKESDNGKGKR